MKDLYGRLNIPPYAPIEMIRGALDRCADPALKSDAEAVLLDPRHRAAYDRTHRLLATVGTLRRRTNLHLRPFWARSGNQDFSGALSNTSTGVHGVASTKPAATRRVLIAIGLAVLLAIGWLVWKRH